MDSQLLQNYFHESLNDFKINYSKAKDRKLRILQWNIRGMNALDKFDSILYFLNNCGLTIDVIVLSETWIKANSLPIYEIPGYISTFSCRESSHGGLALYVNNKIHHNVISNHARDGLHSIRVELTVNGFCFEVIGVYRPPSYDFQTFYDILEEWLHNSKKNTPCFIIGDVNVPVNLMNNNIVTKYRSLLESYGFICANSIVTRPASNNILDHVVCKSSDAFRLRNDTIYTDISDHLQILSSIQLNGTKRKQTLIKKVVDNVRLTSMFNHYIDSITCVDDVESCFSEIITKYGQLLALCTTTFATQITAKNLYCPWMTYDLWKLMQIKIKYLKLVKRNPNDLSLCDMLEHISKKVSSAKRTSKKHYYERLLSTTCHSKLWKNINIIFGRTKGKEKINLVANGRKITDTPNVCEIFNNYFSTIGVNLASRISNLTNMSPASNVCHVTNSIFLRPTNINEVTALIRELDINKSPGPDNIPASIIKGNPQAFAFILSQAFNKIVDTGEYPICLKTARVVPIFKSGDVSDPCNYRPVSTLSVFSKILEKLLTARLFDFLKANNIIYKFQYGFRKQCGTMTAITELVDDLIDRIDKKNIVGGLFLDLKKAFDTLNHNILLQKLEAYGIRGIANDVIRSYLSNRTQFVAIENVRSSLRRIEVGVPQGSNVGPLLFLLYVNDIGRLKLKGLPRLFADDTALFYPCADASTIITSMEHDLRILMDYFNANLLSLNLTKTKYMLFHSPRKKIANHANPRLNQIDIDMVDDFKYLGIHLDSTLSWDRQIRHVEHKLSSLTGALKKVSYFVPKKALLSFYYGCIHSQIQYLISVWGHASKSKLKKVQTLQNRCLKIIFKLPILHPTLLLYSNSSHKILPPLALRNIQIAIHIHKVLHHPEFHHNIPLNVGSRTQNTRQANLLQRQRANTNLGQTRMSNFGPSIYNTLPNELKQISNLDLFKFKIKQHFKTTIQHFII